MGPGIPDSSHNPEPNLPLLFDRLLRRESFCSYRGILKGPLLTNVTTDQEISLVVPPGAPRLIQVVGLIERNGSNDCQAEFFPGTPPVIGPSGVPAEADAYELGRAVLPVFQDQTVSISMDYNLFTTDAERATREMKCGSGSSANTAPVLTPIGLAVPSGGALVDLSMGKNHLCGIFGSPGMVYCRGAGNVGQLGDGFNSDRSTFVPTSPVISGATQIALGDGFSCALVGGGVKCWGAGLLGQLGNGSFSNSNAPVIVVDGASNPLIGVASISAGLFHACARLTAGGVVCWGSGANGRLGNGGTANSGVAVNVGGITTAAEISLGGAHGCARLLIGTVTCWGLGNSGQLGDGLGASSATANSIVTGISTAVHISLGSAHSCAVLSDDTGKCWGAGTDGQLGNGSTENSLNRVNVGGGIPTITGIAAGAGHSCALTSAGAIYCWGVGPLLGNNTTVGSSTPVANTALTANVAAIFFGSVSGTACVALPGPTVKCWGDNTYHQIAP